MGSRLKTGGGQFRGLTAPLFFRVAVKEIFVDPPAHHLERLFFKVPGFRDAFVPEAGDEILRLGWSHAFAEQLIDGHQIDRQAVDTSAG